MVGNAYYARIIGEAYEAHGVGHLRQDYGCLEMREWNEPSLPSRFAALYTKLHFLLAIELSQEQVRQRLQIPLCGECTPC